MLRTWWRSLTTRPSRPERSRRKTGLGLARLEDRTAPAVTYTLDAGRLVVNLSDNNDIATIRFRGGLQEPLPTGVIGVFPGEVQDVRVVGQIGALGQRVNIEAAFNLTGNLSVTDVSIIDLRADLAAASITLAAGSPFELDQKLTTKSGAVTITADRLDLQQALDAATVILQPTTPGRAVLLGSEDPNRFSLSDAELDLIKAGVLRIGTDGPIELSGSVSLAAGAVTTLELQSGDAISQTSADGLTVKNLAATAAGPISLTANNAVSVLAIRADDPAGSNDRVVFHNVAPLRVGVVAGLGGVTSAHQSVELTVAAGQALTVAGKQSVTAGTWALLAAGAIAVGTSTADDYGTVGAGTDVLLRSTTGAVSLCGKSAVVGQGTLAFHAATDFTMQCVGTDGPKVKTSARVDVVAGQAITLELGSGGIDPDTVTMTADVMNINTEIIATKCVILEPATAGRPILLGDESGAALSLEESELDFIDAPVLQIGNVTSGAVTLSDAKGAINFKTQNSTTSKNPVGTLQLVTAQGVSTAATGRVSVDNLAVQADGAVALTGLNEVSFLAVGGKDAASKGAASLNFKNGNTADMGVRRVTLCDGTFLDGVTSTGDVKVDGGKSVTVNQPINATGNVTITAGENVVINASVTAGQAVTVTAGDDVTIDQGAEVKATATSVSVSSGPGVGDDVLLDNGGKITAGTDVLVVAKSGEFKMTGIAGGGGVPKIDAPGVAAKVTVTAASIVLAPGGGGIDPAVLTLTADTMAINQPLVATQCVVLQPATVNWPVFLGVDNDLPGALRLSDAELDFVDAPALVIGNTTTGTITISGAIDLKQNVLKTLELYSGATVTADFPAGKLTVNKLAVTAGGDIKLRVFNDVNVFAASANDPTAAKQDDVTFFDVNDFTADSIALCAGGTLTGVTSKNDNVELEAVGSLTVNTPVDAPLNVTLTAVNGSITVNAIVTAGKNVTATAGTFITTNAAITAGQDATAKANGGSVTVNAAVTATAGNVLITATDDVTIDNAAEVKATAKNVTITAGTAADDNVLLDNGAKITAGGDVSITAGGSFTMTGKPGGGVPKINAAGNVFITAASIDLQAGGGGIDPLVVTLTADSINIAQPVVATDCVIIKTLTNSRPISLGAEVANTLSLTDAELDFVSTKALQIGTTANTGGISVTGGVTLNDAKVPTLDLRTGADIGTNGGLLAVKNLAAEAGGAITLSGDNAISVASFKATGDVFYRNINLALDKVARCGDTLSLSLPPNKCFIFDTSAGTTAIDLKDASLDKIPSAVVQIGVTNLVTVTNTQAALAPLTKTLHIVAQGDVTSAGAAGLIVQNLAVNAGGKFAFTGAGNDVDVLATSTKLSTEFRDADGLTVGTVTVCGGIPVSGATTPSADITIKAGGAVTLAQPVNAGGGTVRITAGGDVTQAAAGLITAGALGVRAAGLIDLRLANTVPVFAAQSTAAAQAILFQTTGPLTVNSIGVAPPLFNVALNGVATTAGGNITLKSGGALAVNQPVNAGAGIVRLVAGGDVTQAAPGVITAGKLGVLAAGAVNLDTLTNAVGTFAGASSVANQPIRLKSSAAQLNVDTVTANSLFPGLSGVTTVNGDIALTADGLEIVQPIFAGVGCVVIQPLTGGQAISLGAEIAGQLSLTNAELNLVTARVLQVGSTGAGTLTNSGAVTLSNLKVPTLDLRSGKDILTAGGSLTVVNLTAEALGKIVLDGPNVITGVVAAAAGKDLVLRSTAFNVGTVLRCDVPLSGLNATCVVLDAAAAGATFGLGGGPEPSLTQAELDLITATQALQIGNGNVQNITATGNLAVNFALQFDLLATGGDITSTGTLTVFAGGGRLSAEATGVVTLPGANDVAVVALKAGAGAVFDDANAVTVGEITRCDASKVTGVQGSFVALRAGISAPGSLLATINDVKANTTDVTLTADAMALGAKVIAPGCVVLQQLTPGTAINLGAEAGGLSLTDAELDQIAANILQVGNTASGTVAVAGPVSIAKAAVPSLDLRTGGSIVTTAGGVAVFNLAAVTDAGSIALTGANDADNFSGRANGDLTFTDNDDVSVTPVPLCPPGPPTLAEATSKTGSVRFFAGGLITLNENVTAVATVGFSTTAGGVTQNAGVVTGNLLRLDGVGAFTLNQPGNFTPPGNDVVLIEAAVTGPVTYRDASDLVVGPGGIATGGNALTLIVRDNFTLPAGVAINLGAADGTVFFAQVEDGAAGGTGSTVRILGDVTAVTFNVKAADGVAGKPFNVKSASAGPSNSQSNQFFIRPSTTANIKVFGADPTLADVQFDAVKYPGDSLSFVDLPAGVSIDLKNNLPDTTSGKVTFNSSRGTAVVEFDSIEQIRNLSLQAFAIQTLDGRGLDAFALSIKGTLNGQPIGGQFTGSLPKAAPFLAAPQLTESQLPFRVPSLAIGDVNGDGVPDLVVGLGPNSGGPLVTVIDGQDIISAPAGSSQPLTDQQILTRFFAFDETFNGGVFVAAADFDGDNRSEIVTGAGRSGGPHVRLFSVTANIEPVSGQLEVVPRVGSAADFFAYDPRFSGGVRVTAADIDGDGTPDIVTGAGPGGGPHVRVFNVAPAVPGGPINIASFGASFFAYDPNFLGGIYVDAGDIDRVVDPVTKRSGAEILTGAGFGGGPHVRVFTGAGAPFQNGALDFLDAPTTVENSLLPGETSTLNPNLQLDNAAVLATSGIAGVGLGLGDGDANLDIFVGTGTGRQVRARFYRVRFDAMTNLFFLDRNVIGAAIPTLVDRFNGERSGVSVATSAANVLNGGI